MMSEKQAPSNLKPEERPQRSFMDRALGRFPEQDPAQGKTEEGPDSPHEHLFHVVVGNSGLVIRWCERCGKSFLLQQVNELIQKTTTYQWG
jgi:hypothetical protein